MTDRVEALISRLAPEPICDGCIVDRLGLALHQVSQRTRMLTGTRGFEHCQQPCATCGERGAAIRRRSA